MNDLLRRALWLPEQASTFAPRIDRLHYAIILVTLAAAFGVALVALGLFVRYRRRHDDQPIAQHTSQPGFRFEAISIGVPLVVFLTWWVIGFRQFLDMATPPPDAMDVHVTAKKWMWKFAYPGGPSSIEVLHVPAGRPVRLLLTSRDVIHSFFVPAFRIKQDAVPGRFAQTWFQATRPGSYQVLCAEYCGLDHSVMWAEIVVHEPADFDRWLADQRRGVPARQDGGGPEGSAERMEQSAEGVRGSRAVSSDFLPSAPLFSADLVEQGRRIAVSAACVKCHTIDGTPHIGPTFLDLYRRFETLTDGSTVLADEAYLTESIMDPLARVVAGYPPVMPTYQGRLGAPEIGALVEYMRSLRSPGPAAIRSREPTFLPRATGAHP